MTDPKDKRESDLDDYSFEIENLPPLDHDETTDSNPEEMASFLDPFETEESREPEGHPEDECVIDSIAIARELLDDTSDSSFVDDQNSQPRIHADVEIEDESSDWSGDEDVTVDDLGDDWFLDEDKSPVIAGDDGQEGPTDEKLDSLGIDENTWDPLGDEDSSDDSEEPLQAMERLGIELPFNEEDASPGCPMVIDTQFLGPDNGGVAAVVFERGSPLAAGEGLFVLGADGMFHATWPENTPSFTANSIYVRGESIFLGTAAMGALVTHDRGQHYRQLNTWFTQGLPRGVQASSEQVSTSFKIYGQVAPFGNRLLGCTGRGQLFSSVDSGRTWRNLAIPGQCLTLSAISGSSEIFMVTRGKDERLSLWRCENTDNFEHRSLPDFWEAESELFSAISIKATSDTLIIGSDDPAKSVAFSVNGGNTWSRVEEAGGATAVALDPDDPMCMAAATYDSNQDLGSVIYSEDRGQSWQTVLTIETSSVQDPKNQGSAKSLIMDLVIHAGRTREIVAVTKKGAYFVTLTRKGVTH